MNKTIQTLIEAINMIPRQFYNTIDEGASELAHEKFVSQLTVRYRKITGDYCSTELFLPSSEAVQKKYGSEVDGRTIFFVLR